MDNSIPEQTQKFSELKKEQKEAIGLLSIGTFLEYFDLMLYVHMAVLLNELFFPPSAPETAGLLSALAFCSTYVLRPFGALLFGYIGDNVGRKATVIITTMMMSVSCLVMANLSTYAEMGIAAAYIVTICRIVQGLSSMGEGIGAELYVTELLKPPARYPAVAFLVVFATVGTVAALGIASLVTSFNFNWRVAFFIGAGIAFIGTVARTALRETPEFADAKRRYKNTLIKTNIYDKDEIKNKLKNNIVVQEKVNKKSALSLFLIQCLWPICMYFAYIHCGNILKNTFGFTSEQVIHQNFIVSLSQLCSYFILTYLSYKIHPLKILKVKLFIFLAFVINAQFILVNISTPLELLIVQSFVVVFVPTDFPAASVFCMHFPVFKRFTYASLTYAIPRALMSVVTSFGLVFLTNYFGHWGGLLILIVPVLIGYAFGLFHFIKLEQEAGRYLATRIFPQLRPQSQPKVGLNPC